MLTAIIVIIFSRVSDLKLSVALMASSFATINELQIPSHDRCMLGQ